MKITLCNDLERIRSLLDIDDLRYAIAQYADQPFDIQDLGTSYYLILSDINNDNGLYEDIGIFILDQLAYNHHFNVHVAFTKSSRGFKTFVGGKLFIEYMKSILPHACIMGMIPVTKTPAMILGSKIGFKMMVIIPSAIEIGNKNNIDAERVDMAIMAINW